MGLVKISDIKEDEFQLVRLNMLLNFFLQMITEIDAKLQSKDIKWKERRTLEVDRRFLSGEYSTIKEGLETILHDLGLDGRGGWILYNGKLRRGFRVVSGKRTRMVGVIQRNPCQLKLA